MMIERPDGTFDVNGRLSVEDFEARLGHVLTDAEREADIETVGGLVFTLAGRVPARGEVISHPSGIEFRVLDGDPRHIRRLRVRAPAAMTHGAADANAGKEVKDTKAAAE
jgi:magnesium and cobalt transporter